MKKIIIIGLLLTACNERTKSGKSDSHIQDKDTVITEVVDNSATEVIDSSPMEVIGDSPFSFSEFKIMKGQLGEIKIGMTIKEAESKLAGLTRKKTPVYRYGFDGEEPCFSYYLQDTLVLALIPKYNTDSLLCIVAAHKNLRTTNGLNPKSTVIELLEKYPNLEVGQNMENGWEYIYDTENKWSFDFATDEKNQIAEYPIPGKPSKPKRLTAKSDWVMIYDR